MKNISKIHKDKRIEINIIILLFIPFGALISILIKGMKLNWKRALLKSVDEAALVRKIDKSMVFKILFYAL